MRVLLIHPGAHFSVHDVTVGWHEGLKANGCDVQTFNFHDRLAFYSHAGFLTRDEDFVNAFDAEAAAQLAANGIKAACYEWAPEVVVVVSGFFVPADFYPLMHARGSKVVLLHTEQPYEHDRQLRLAPLVDLNILNDPTGIDAFQQCAPSVYIPHAYRPDTHYRRPTVDAYRSEFCFVGTGYKSRVEFLEAVDWGGIDVALGGNWQQLRDESPLRKFVAHDIEDCLDNEQTVEMYSSADVSANLYRREAERPELADGWAMGPREVELAATETFFLRDPRPESDAMFPMLPTFTDPGDFGEKLRWALAHPNERADAATAAHAAIADRTFTNHAAQLLRLLSH